MAAKIIAQVVVQTATILSKAFFTAYQQALHNAKSGGAAAPNMAKVMKYKLHPDEACKIFNLDKKTLSKSAVEERYNYLFGANDTKKGGSFYLQSKVFRAKEVLDRELSGENKKAEADFAAKVEEEAAKEKSKSSNSTTSDQPPDKNA